MGWPNLNINEVARCRIAKASSILNILGVLLCVIVLITGTYILLAIQSKMHLVEGFSAETLPVFMITVGFVGTLLSILGIKICWSSHKPHKRKKWNTFLLCYIIGVLILFLSIFISAIMCFVAIGMLEDAFTTGIYSSMKRYHSYKNKKQETDQLQIEYRCCGSKAYTDWFHTNWIHDDYLGETKMAYVRKTGTKYLNDDVPFSCCDPEQERPCIHHHIHDNDLHYNYDFRAGLSIFRIGCTEALMNFYGKKVLVNIGGVIMFASVLELAILIIARFLQTSIASAIEKGDVESTTFGYLFPFGPEPSKDKKDVKKTETKDEAKQSLLQPEVDSSFTSEFDEPPTPSPIKNAYVDGPGEEHIYENIPAQALRNGRVSMTGNIPLGHYEEIRPQPPNNYNEPIYENVGNLYNIQSQEPQPNYGSRAKIAMGKPGYIEEDTGYMQPDQGYVQPDPGYIQANNSFGVPPFPPPPPPNDPRSNYSFGIPPTPNFPPPPPPP